MVSRLTSETLDEQEWEWGRDLLGASSPEEPLHLEARKTISKRIVCIVNACNCDMEIVFGKKRARMRCISMGDRDKPDFQR